MMATCSQSEGEKWHAGGLHHLACVLCYRVQDASFYLRKM